MPDLKDQMTAVAQQHMTTYLNEVEQYDAPYVERMRELIGATSLLWIMKDYDSLVTPLTWTSILIPDDLRSLRGRLSLAKDYIQREGYRFFYRINIQDEFTILNLSQQGAIDLCDQALADSPVPPPPDRSQSLVIMNPNLMAEIESEVANAGLSEILTETLLRLRNYSDKQYFRCLLYPDRNWDFVAKMQYQDRPGLSNWNDLISILVHYDDKQNIWTFNS